MYNHHPNFPCLSLLKEKTSRPLLTSADKPLLGSTSKPNLASKNPSDALYIVVHPLLERVSRHISCVSVYMCVM